jgi:phospholipid-binding lipoprotein MlaA
LALLLASFACVRAKAAIAGMEAPPYRRATADSLRVAQSPPEEDPLFGDDAGDAADDAGGTADDPLYGDEFDRELEEQQSGFPDPLEKLNRGTLHVNRFLDRLLLDPLTHLYDVLVPEAIEPAIRRAFQHFGTPAELLNETLQFRLGDAGETVLRFGVNTTVGVFGLFDFARCEGLEHHHADFGQTLASYHIGSGPYLIVPLLGPSTVRDLFGDFVDALLHPARYFLGPTQQLTFGGGAGLAAREKHYQALDELENTAVDFYAALRNAFYQARTAEIEQGVDRDVVAAEGVDADATCARTVDGKRERTIGPPPARGLPADPVSRWSPRAAGQS